MKKKLTNVKKNILFYPILWIIMIIVMIYTVSALPAWAKTNKLFQVESSTTPEVNRNKPLPNPTSKSLLPVSNGLLKPAQTTTQSSMITLGPNLISNASFEDTDSNGNPTGWNKGGYGNNTRIFSYPVGGNGDAKAAQVTVSNYVSGDAKWFFNDVSVKPGEVYNFSNYSKSDVPSIIDVRYKMSDGTFVYKDIAFVNPNNTYQNTTVEITIPQNVISLTIFHLINSNGTLTVDNYSLNQINAPPSPPPPPPPTSNNLVTNGDFETLGTNGLPQGWSKGGWGTNTRIFSYPVNGVNGSKAASVSITSYTSGDAKWYFTPISVPPGIYTYSDQYLSNVPSIITLQLIHIDGSISYKDISTLQASNSFTSVSVDFSIDNSVKSLTVFHLIQSVGSLSIDNVSVQNKAVTSGIFTTGAVTLRFDDEWLSQYKNAIPKMNSSGIKGTFYIVSRQTADDGFSEFMSKAQIKDIYSMGNEIGAHTRTHPFLTTLSQSGQQDEIQGSRSDLLALDVGPILSFAYPFGDYDTTSLSIVQNSGFTSAAATIDGFVSPSSDKYQLERQGPLVNTPLSQIKQWIDDAQTNKKWLIITFHQIDTNGGQYSVTPATFNQIIDYIVQKQIPVVTISQGIQSF